MKAVIYSRVSTQDQTTENQVLRLKDYCKLRGWEVVGEYSDTISGLKDRRPGLDKLLRDARKRKFDVVVAVKLDRLGRSTQHLLSMVDELDHFKVNLAFTDQPIDTTGPMGRMVFTILGAVAEFERELIVERTKAGLDRAKRKGKTLGRPKLSQNLIDKIVQLRKEKWSYRVISKETGVSIGMISRVLAVHKSPPQNDEEFPIGNDPVHKTRDLETEVAE